MKGNFNAKTAIALLDSTKVAAPQVRHFGDSVAKTFSEIAQTEKINAGRAILIGMALPILKASMPRGEFTPWMKANLTRGKIWTEGTAIKNASLYTRLAHAFLEHAKPDATEILAITNGRAITGKAGKDAKAAKLLRSVADFVGEASLAELIREHVHDRAPSGGGDEPAAPALPADDNTLLQDVAESLLNLRKTVVDPETLKRFTAPQLSELEAQMTATLEDFRKAREALRG